jgi:DegV family protein with EDD domain
LPVGIVTDSTTDLAPEVAAKHDVSIVPLSVIFGDDVYREGKEITPDLFYDKLGRAKELPTTSAPSVGDFLDVYREKLKTTDEIVSIHLSSKLSATYSNACQAAAQLADEGAKIDVFDSQTVSYGAQFLVTAAARAAASGSTVEEIRKALDGMVERIHVYIVLDTLEYVRRGGRIGRARAFLGTVLRVKPILSIHHGEVHPEERVRTRAHALERVFQLATSYPNVEEIGVAYSTNAQEAEEMKRRLEQAFEGVPIGMARLGPVVGVHGGPGTLGIGLLEGEH